MHLVQHANFSMRYVRNIFLNVETPPFICTYDHGQAFLTPHLIDISGLLWIDRQIEDFVSRLMQF